MRVLQQLDYRIPDMWHDMFTIVTPADEACAEMRLKWGGYRIVVR